MCLVLGIVKKWNKYSTGSSENEKVKIIVLNMDMDFRSPYFGPPNISGIKYKMNFVLKMKNKETP